MKDLDHIHSAHAALSIHRLTARGVTQLRHKQVAMRSMAQSVFSLASGEHGELGSEQLQEIADLADAIRQMADEVAKGINILCDQINSHPDRMD